MNEKAIRRIQGIGLAGQIIANVLKVLLIIAAVALAALSLGLFALPEGAVMVEPSGEVSFKVDTAALGGDPDRGLYRALLDPDSGISVTVMDDPDTRVSVDGNVITFSGAADSAPWDVRRLLPALLLGLLYLAAVIVTLFFIASLCKSLRRSETPFTEKIVGKLRAVAWSLIPWAVLSGLDDPLSPVRDGRMELNFGIDLKMVLLVLLVLAISVVFQYGVSLQREADETL